MGLAALLLLCSATPAVQDPPPPPPAEEENGEGEEQEGGQDEAEKAPTPEEAAKAIADALRDRELDAETLQALLEKFGLVADPLVTKELGKGVKHKEDFVRTACLVALRWNEDATALDELLRFKRDRKLHEAAATGVAYALGLGQKAAKDADSAAKVTKVLGDLVDDQDLPFAVTQAALRGLGRCRVDEAPAELMDFLKGAPVRAKGYITDVRISMGVLLGHDAGNRPVDWTDWWGDAGKKMKVPAEPYEIPQERVRLEWEELWKSPMQKEAERLEREERMKKAREERQRRGGGDGA